MKKRRPRRGFRRSGYRGFGYGAYGPPTFAAELAVTKYLSDKPELPAAHAAALRAAMPRDVALKTSHWLEAGAIRGQASGLSYSMMLTLLGEFLIWCYGHGHLKQPDAVISTVQLELLRRKGGMEAETVGLPSPLGPEEMQAQELVDFVANWEVMSYSQGLLEPGDEELGYALLMAGSSEVVSYLAQVDGVPVRLPRMDPAGFALELASRTDHPTLGPPPAGYVTTALRTAAAFYERCAERGLIDREEGGKVCDELLELALVYSSPMCAA